MAGTHGQMGTLPSAPSSDVRARVRSTCQRKESRTPVTANVFLLPLSVRASLGKGYSRIHKSVRRATVRCDHWCRCPDVWVCCSGSSMTQAHMVS